jgi:membrane protease YdiL (CAAX protease family)
MSVSFNPRDAAACRQGAWEAKPMTVQAARPAAARESVLIATAVSAALVWSLFSGDLMRLLITHPPKIAYFRSVLATGSDLVLMIGLTALASRRSPGRHPRADGVANLSWRHLVWAGLVFGPVVVAAALLTPLASGLGAKDFVWPGVVGPFTEELFYRGLAIGVLMRAAGWRFLPAALLPAAVFGLAHLWQGEAPLETAAAVAITGAGAIGLGWLYLRWGDALWPPVLMHVGMNSLWTAFALGDTAVGGLMGNALRLATVALAIGLTLRLAPRQAPAP